ncbi:MAG: PAS domain S-box protein [Geopsychrobacter sp.]|nr:PAS domain S-box protein [Geopsychrobacter sp.]
MVETFHILHLEDNPNDGELVRYSLDASEIACRIELVQGRQAFLDALDKWSFDIVLADYSLPDYNGMAALEEVQRRQLVLPFVLVTGALGGERAIDCIKAGMDDYVLKTNLARLTTVVPRAIAEKKSQWQHGLALENLRLSEERFDLAVRGSGAGIWDWPDLQKNHMWWSPRIYEMFGYEEDEIFQTTEVWTELVFPEDQDLFEQSLREHLESHQPYDIEYRVRPKTGQPIWVRARGSALWNEAGQPVRMAGYLQDISDRKATEAENRRLNEHYRTITHTVNEAIVMLDAERRISFWNPAAKQIFGFTRDEAMGKDLHQLLAPQRYHAAALAGMAEFFKMGKGPALGKTLEVMGLHRDGHEIPIELSLACIEREDGRSAVGVIHDISERKAAEQEVAELHQQLAQAQKMEAIGTLAGGIAHDFNNILAAIIGYSSLVKARLPHESREFQDMSKVLQAGERAKYLVRQILTFARKTELEKKPVAIDLIIKEVLQLLRASLPSTIAIRKNIELSGCTILGSPTEIHQVLMNLCTNSFHAMAKNGGELTVSLHQIQLAGHERLSDGLYLQLTVEDTGEGINPQIFKKIFDPYFTTKDIDRGTGLGLSVVQGIIQRLGGSVEVESEVDVGSCFTILLPCYSEDVPEEKIMDILAEGGGEHIMYVDDEEGLAILGQEFLEDMGYSVTPLFSSREALDTFRADPQKYDLVVTDHTMPGMTGVEMAVEMAKISPETPVVLCSGFKMSLDSPGVAETSICEVLLKPEVFDRLPQVLSRLFNHNGGS